MKDNSLSTRMHRFPFRLEYVCEIDFGQMYNTHTYASHKHYFESSADKPRLFHFMIGF